MKKFFIAAISALTLSAASALAQNQGEMYVGGTIGGAYYNKVGQFNFQGEFGYFFIDNFRANLGVGYQHVGNSQEVRTTNDSFVIEPEFAVYIRLIDKLFYTPEIGVDLGWGDANNRYENYSTHQPSFIWNLYLNYACFEYKPVRYLGFTVNVGSISVGGTKVKESNQIPESYEGSFGVNLLASCSIGAKYYF